MSSGRVIKEVTIHVRGIFEWASKRSRYGLDGSAIEAPWQRDLPQPPGQALGLTQPPVQWDLDLFHGRKAVGCGVDHSYPNKAEVKERVQLCL